ncbi:MAG: matrixin family metalloprotease [Bryobacterales bacterium]|nr:matrixin family metalloprotease [Bryobacterales bacterium]
MRGQFPFKTVRRSALALAGLLAMLSPLSGYYHFLHVRQDGDRSRAIPERFDLRGLPDAAVPLVVSKSVDLEFADGDVWESVLSQVRLAASEWSRVRHSALRLRYAGEVSAEPPAGTPYVQVMFDELPPGVIAMAGPVARQERSSDDNGEFIPISRSVVILSHRLKDRPSHSEAFFMTLVHEMGHALGLQHSFTGSTMSTGVTRATTKSAPLAEDDHAGLASLYPDAHFAADTGTIRGRLTADGEPLHFASVTALKPSGVAVSALSLPDGSYEIKGLPPGGYYLYAQPVAPSTQEGLGPGQIVLPKDEAGNAIAAGGLFATRFYPEALDWHAAHELVSTPGSALNDIHLNVPRVDFRAFGDITTYSFPASFAVNPAVVNTGANRPFLVAIGPNLVAGGRKADGLKVDSTAAGISDDDVSAYDPAPEFLRVDLTFHPFSASMGAKPLLWSRNGESFVQPAAFRVVGQQPPDVKEAQVEAGADATQIVRLRGEQLAPSFTYLFDGLAAEALPVSDDAQSKEMALRAPFTTDGRPVRAVALGSDGQSSLYLNANPPVVGTRAAGTAVFKMNATALPAGAETMVEIEAESDWFAEGQLGIAFNTPHLVARSIWRPSPQRLIANVKAMPGAPSGDLALWLRKDLATVNAGRYLTISNANPRAISLDSRLVDESTGDATVYPGSTALVRVSGEGLADTVSLRLADRPLSASRVEGSLFRFAIPADFPLGMASLEAAEPGRETFPIAVNLAGPPPAIVEGGSFSRADGPGTRVYFRARLLIVLPEVNLEAQSTPALEVRVNGQAIRDFERSNPIDGRIPVSFDVPVAFTTPIGDGPQPTSVSVQVEWAGRHSAPFALPLSGM